MSALPALLTVGGVTQRRVALSEWTKLRSVRSTRWSLLASLVLLIGIGILACTVFESRWPHLSPRDRHDFHPLRVSLAGVNFAQLALGVLGARDHRRILDGDDPRNFLRGAEAPLGPVGQGVGVRGGCVRDQSPCRLHRLLRRSVDSLRSPHQHRDLASRRSAGTLRCGSLLDGDGPVRPRSRRDRPQHRRRHCRARRDRVRPAAGHQSAPFEHHELDRSLSTEQRRGAVWTINADPNTLAPWTGFALFCAYAALALAVAAVLMRRRDT
jgi:ABC-2 type transport system permease protein